jgi:hypothetical protein
MESDLYAPVKALLEGQGYTVKGEIRGCDVVGVRGDEIVVVELKKLFGIGVVLQGVDRLGLTDTVYLAVGKKPKQMKNVRKLCLRLGLGLIVVSRKKANVLLDPMAYVPRKNAYKVKRLLGEHQRRVGDPNLGGRPMRGKMPIMTAYRQAAIRCAGKLAEKGPMKLAELRVAAEAPNAANILRDDYYGWFERVERGIYTITPKGKDGLKRFETPPSP